MVWWKKKWNFIYICTLIVVWNVLGQCMTKESHTGTADMNQWTPTYYCDFYDYLCKNGTKSESAANCSKTVEACPTDGGITQDKRMHCYAAWKNTTDGIEVLKKGCWIDLKKCYDQEKCINTDTDEHAFCCCEGDYCNRDLYHDPKPTQNIPTVKPITGRSHVFSTLMYSLVPIFGITFIVIIIFWMWRKHRQTDHEILPTTDPSPLPPPSPIVGLKPLELIEMKARGRFGSVWKAQTIGEIVAVKIFPAQDRQSWAIERELYRLPGFTNHDNILKFLGAERRGDKHNVMEFWLISEFHERGSLHDFLKGTKVNWEQLCTLMESMIRGLAFVHEDIPATKSLAHKPSIAHRDFKSKNVLVKNNLTACIADFGLAIKFEPGECPGDAHGQVGTRRYMAPEVLEGAINFNRDSFLRIDMYACGLVLWEMLSRCTIDECGEYKMPYEAEAGPIPTLENMQDVVVQKKLRPQFKESWYKHEGAALLIETIQECWDHEAEARLSAGCVEERLAQLTKSINSSSTESNLTDIVTSVTSSQEMILPPKENSISV